MDENNQNSENNLSPTPANQSLPDLSPTNYNTPRTTRSFEVSDPNLKPLEVNLPTAPNMTSAQIQQPVTTSTPATNYSESPSLQSPTNQVVTNDPVTTVPDPGVSSGAQVFVNPNPPPPPTTDFQNVTNQTTSAPQETGLNDQLLSENSSSGIHNFPISKKLLLIISSSILILGIGAFAVNEVFFNRISTLKLISEDAQFYLSLSVKKNPQAEKAKTMIKKFPGGDKMLKEFDKYYANFTGNDPKNPFNDITAYAESELFLARQSRAEDKFDYSQRMITIVDLESSKKAAESIADFQDDKATYSVATQDYKGSKLYTIKLKSEQELYENRLDSRNRIEDGLSTPKPLSVFATNIDKYIIASDKDKDIEKAIELSDSKSVFGFKSGDNPKNITDASDHKQISRFFPKETFLRFFQREPITPYNLTTPFFSSSVSTYANEAETEARTFQKLSRGVDAKIVDDGVEINDYLLNNILKDDYKADTFKISSSLASKLPKKYSEVAPTFYGETKNIQGQWQRQLKIAEELKNSKNRTQREQFERYLESLDQAKKSYSDMYSVDYESDILSWMEGQVAFIFNAGSSKKGPEFLLVSETGAKDKAKKTFEKFEIPDYSIIARDSQRTSSLSEINYSLRSYYSINKVYPTTLSQLTDGIYFTQVPTDPTTKKSYNYSPSADKKSFTLSGSLENGQTITYTQASYSPKLSGEKKSTTLKATSSKYKEKDIFTIKIFEYEKVTYSLFGAITDSKAILMISDNDKSIKEIIDFEKNPNDSLSKNSAWDKQFGKIKDELTTVGFIEPVNIWGFMDYLKATYPEYKESASRYSQGVDQYWDDLEKIAKGYLKTVPSIGTVSKSEKDVIVGNTFVNIVELSSNEKKEAEDALGRLLKTDSSNNYNSVLGIDSKSTIEKIQEDWGVLYNNKIKGFIDPQKVIFKD